MLGKELANTIRRNSLDAMLAYLKGKDAESEETVSTVDVHLAWAAILKICRCQTAQVTFGVLAWTVLGSIVHMANLDTQEGWNYHNATKHSRRSVWSNPHFLDWANQPLPFKIYPKLGLIPLPRELCEIGVPALRAIAEVAQRDNARPDLQTLSELLYFSAGVTRRRTFPSGEIYFRSGGLHRCSL